MINRTDPATLSEYVHLSNQEKKATGQPGDEKAVGSKSQTSSDQSLSHRAVSLTEQSPGLKVSEKLKLTTTSSPKQTAIDQMHSPFKADDITINDLEFRPPPSKIKKLSLAIKIFSKSFMRTSHFNNQETDRSARVETIRNRVSTLTAGLLDILTGAIILKGFIEHLGSRESLGASEYFPGLVVTYLIATIVIFGAFGIGWLLSQGITRLVTSTVAASVDTREKLAEMTAFTSPEEKFLKKYQRMEESLCALQTKLIDAKLARTLRNCDRGNAEIKAKERARKETARLNPGADKETWFESIQREHLRDWYEFYAFKIEELEQDIRRTKDWLDRAAKQKALLTNEQRELEELYDDVAPPIAGKLQLEPFNLIHV
ncbi:hypothetical protein [Salinisphaera sp. G21_0]|uniref:hypothetical protein n=1 Tax=Salinisphaera sp. G21_0 TaxID=2821094 RepID=UPI001ADC6704|nr:hypothetical protein [Salinisphaera sp. G21_0]MBO9483067.1 hypothetical protein [Salinisphaera sp. G21_0]